MSAFKLTFAPDDRLPRLAWCARVDLAARSAVVSHGPWIETGPDLVVEGAWGNGFGTAGFADALVFTGTGLVADADGLRFVSPTHTLQPLVTLRRARELFCSNSLVFVLAASRTKLDPSYRSYDHDLMSVMEGLRRYIRRVPVLGAQVDIHYHCNLRLRTDGGLERQDKRSPEPFRDFAAYRAFLEQQVSRVTENARDRRRLVTYEPVTTISSGYDSPACAVLARAAGCERALTFTKARGDFADREDSGRAGGERLGLRVAELDPEQYLTRSDLPEAEFIATGTGGDDIIFSAAEKHLERVLLFTGYHGDKVWNRVNDHVGPDIVRGDPSGGSLSEFRLRVGFINVPVALIGCVRHPDIHAISNSAEMAPWSLPGTDYDRPIPRRIVETAGVPREMFGQRKKAAAMPYQTTSSTNPPLRTVLSAASYEDFKRTTATMRLFPTRSEKVRFAVMRRLYRIDRRIADSVKLATLCRRLRLPVHAHTWISGRFAKPRTEHMLAFHWSVERIRPRYDRSERR